MIGARVEKLFQKFCASGNSRKILSRSLICMLSLAVFEFVLAWVVLANTNLPNSFDPLLAVGKFFPTEHSDSAGSKTLVTEHGQIQVSALGRLEPSGEIARVSVPAFLKDERVEVVRVKQGDWVKEGQILCTLDAQKRLRASLAEANTEVVVWMAKRERIRAGAKRGEIDAQKAAITNLEYELQNKIDAQNALISKVTNELEFNEIEAARYLTLHKQGAVSASQYDGKITALRVSKAILEEALSERRRLHQTLTAQIIESKATLSKIAEVRDVDLSVATAELEEAQAKFNKVKTDLDLASIRAPYSGRILKMNVRAGETVTDKGVADLASTNRMLVVAEVHQSDVSKVKVGQSATIFSDSIKKTLSGTVESIGWQVQKQRTFAQDPSSSSDARIVEVKIAVSSNDRHYVENLSNMQVEVSIRCHDHPANITSSVKS
ncbi:MAG: HlyD family efflux transporter periplasmic adaptor subunit [Leptolyngbya sp.]|nr:HlyD family efflux transporter periplasmic adaptor subunit [Candidatus Melainabacteria bacterium]